ncbi:MAG: site-specific integrase [Lachnospiraceae bacterium]|nr:site-specific integrase [Lachnospiraceae bacterium]
MSRSKQRKTMFFSYVKDFFNNMRIELKSERTVNTYRESLNSFRIYLGEQYSKSVDTITFDFVTDQIIREYVGWVAEHNSVGTRNVRLAALKAYVKYAASKDLELVPLQISISTLKNKTVRPKKHNWLDKEQILLLLEQPPRTRFGIRDRFIILFLFTTGARLSEMLAVKIGDIVLDGKYPYVRLTGKGNKPRIVPVPDDSFIENFRYYCKLFHTENNPKEYLFYTTIHGRLNPMSEDNVQRILKKYGDAARKADSSIPTVHPHLLRHSYGAQMYRLGLSLPEIAKLLGHEDIATTEIYAETDVEMAAEALKKMIGTQPSRKWDSLSEDDKLKLLGLK